MKYTILLASLLILHLFSNAQQKNYPQGTTIWFDTPTSLNGKAIWYGNTPEKWNKQHKPQYAGNVARNPDQEWESRSLPIGNGSIGANIMGSINTERITFNEKSLWRGGPNTEKGASYYWNTNKKSAHLLPQIRQAFIENDIERATKLTRENFNGTAAYEPDRENPFRFGNFTTGGEFLIYTGIPEQGINNYQRILSLDSALTVVQFTSQNVHYQRHCFISYPDNVMILRFRANKKGKQSLSFRYSPNPVMEGKITTSRKNEILYHGRLDNNQMEFAIRIHATNLGGSLRIEDGTIVTENADEVLFFITADTDYKENFDPDFNNRTTYVGIDPVQTTNQSMSKAIKKGYDKLFNNHYQDYSSLFKRVTLSLNGTHTSSEPTDRRLQAYREGSADYGLEQLYYQFGRYLLISSSRPGNLPANLQGMWHNNVDGPWRVDYHNNINLQMNYWPACAGNLSECVLPLINFIRGLEKPGSITAQAYFGARGWTASISGNIFGFTSPLSSQDMSWNFNPMAGPWLATHIWEYYDYTRDKRFLKDIGYDLIKSSAQFACDYLWKRPDGSYTAAPSTSPEHGPIDQGATFVHGVIREILLNAIQASTILQKDQLERQEWSNVLNNLTPYQIGRYGQLMEWSTDIDNPKDDHRHVNHLFGLHPGQTISPITTPHLAQASRVVLEHRGDFATGWSMGWKLNQWARLHDGDHAYKLFGNLLKNGTLDNLWDTHPPFQIDGNFGGTAGVTEMLLQSHLGFIHLLPALPNAWQSGQISGLCARGNFELSIQWNSGILYQAIIISKSGEPCHIRYRDQEISFNTKKNKQYIVEWKANKLQLK